VTLITHDHQPERVPEAPRHDQRSGLGQLTVEQRRGRTVVSRAYASSPLRLLTPANHGHAAWVYTSSYGGGLVNGDSIVMRTAVGPGACAFVSTQASTKVYKSPHGTRMTMTAKVDNGGLLMLIPDPVVCFAKSRYHQQQRFDLASGAALVLVDWLSSGRRESGERWEFDEYISRTIVYLGKRLLVNDALALRSADGDLVRRFGQYDVLATAVVLGRPVQEEARQILARIEEHSATQWPQQIVAGSPIGELGCVFRVAAKSIEQVTHTIRNVLNFVPRRLGDNPWARKW